MVLSPQVRVIPFLHHFGLVERFDILRLCFLAPDLLPLPGSAVTDADNVPSQLRSWPAGLMEIWRTEILVVP